MDAIPHHARLQSHLLLTGFRLGYYTKTDIESWAERWIEAIAQPPIELIDLALIRDTHEQDVIALLGSVGGEVPHDTSIRQTIGISGKLFRSGQIPLRAAIHRIFPLIFDSGVSADVIERLCYLDDGIELAVAGTYGTVEHIETEYLAFTEQYVLQLIAEESDMLGITNGV